MHLWNAAHNRCAKCAGNEDAYVRSGITTGFAHGHGYGHVGHVGKRMHQLSVVQTEVAHELDL